MANGGRFRQRVRPRPAITARSRATHSSSRLVPLQLDRPRLTSMGGPGAWFPEDEPVR